MMHLTRLTNRAAVHHIMEQSCRCHDFLVSRLRLSKSQRQVINALNMRKIVR